MLMLTLEKLKLFKISQINVLIQLHVVFMPCGQTLHGPRSAAADWDTTASREHLNAPHPLSWKKNLWSVLRIKKKNTIFNLWVILSLGPDYVMCDSFARRLWNVFPGNRRRPNCSFMEKNRKTTTTKKITCGGFLISIQSQEKFVQLSWKFITPREHVDIKNDMFQQENELWATQTVKSVFLKQEQHEREVWEELEDTESSCCLHITSLHTGLQTHTGHPDWLCDELKTDMMSLCWSWSRGDKNLHHIWHVCERWEQKQQLRQSSSFHRAWRSWDEELSLRLFPCKTRGERRLLRLFTLVFHEEVLVLMWDTSI